MSASEGRPVDDETTPTDPTPSPAQDHFQGTAETAPAADPREPYAEAGMTLWGSGLGGPLPVPPGQKGPPPSGFTGESGIYPSGADVQAWTEDRPDANVVLRLAPDAVGIDVDAYAAKRGAATLAAAEADLGPLPAGPYSTSRTDGVSRIAMFRVPSGTTLVSALGAAGYGPDVEVIQSRHRYAVVAPSRHPSGATYRWHHADGAPYADGDTPTLADLPDLPQTWLTGLSVDRAAVSGEVLAAPEDWPSAEQTHGYVAALIEGLNADEPRGDWHTWTYAQCCRLAAARRLGLLSDVDLREAQAALVARLSAALPSRSSGEAPHREAARCWRDAVERTSRLTEAQCQASVRGVTTTTAEPLRPVGSAEPLADEDEDDAPEAEPRAAYDPLGLVDLAAILDGTYSEPTASGMPLEDRPGGLLYPGETHSFAGEPSGGKSLLAASEVSRALSCGGRVAYIDFEATAPVLVSRLRALGTADEDIRRGLIYARPQEPFVKRVVPKGGTEAKATPSPGYKRFLDQTLDLVVLDGVTAAMSTFGKSSDDGDAYSEWAAWVPLKIARRTGAAVVMIDHVTKAADSRGRFAIGSQSKLALISGAAYRVDVEAPLGPGRVGRLAIKRTKDRHGAVDALVPADSVAAVPTVAVWTLDATGERLRHSLTGASPLADAAGVIEADYADSEIVRGVVDLLQSNPGSRWSKADLEEALPHRRSSVRQAVDYMLRHGGLRLDGPPKPRGNAPTLRLIRVGDPMPGTAGGPS